MEHQRISSTAYHTAQTRTVTDIPYSQEIATWLARREGHGLALVLEARYKSLSRLLLDIRPTQVLELASGYLPRGLQMSDDPALTYVETDLPEVIETKSLMCRELVGERPNLRFQALSAVDGDFDTLSPHFRNEPLAIVNEGLLMYLDHREKARVCQGVRGLLQRFGGCWLTPDFTATAGLRKRAEPGVQERVERLARMTGRSLSDNAFEDLDEARGFAAEQGFSVREHSQLDVADELSCRRVMPYSDELVRTLLGSRPVFELRLA